MFTLNCKGRLLAVDQPLVMGIINTTPDSFFAGSRSGDAADLLHRAGQMIAEGAAILDIGGQSTRPGSMRVTAAEERARVVPAIAAIHRQFPAQPISVDTFYASVAREAVAAGASLVNDVSAGILDKDLLSTVAELQVPYVLMHMKGNPQNMQQHPHYEDVTAEVFDFISFRLAALTAAGINDVIIDPGFGFGKTIAHNFQLLRGLRWLQQLGRPVMVGLSRKGTVYKTLGITADESLNGSTVLHTMALMNGAQILRVHDVREAVQAVRLFQAYSHEKEQSATAL